MKKLVKQVRVGFFYLISVCLGVYIVVTIGPRNIYNGLLSANLVMVSIALTFACVAALIRVYKLKVLSKKDSRSVMEIFISSRVGKEFSFAGYFIPLIEKKNRHNNTFSNLLVDRYTEIFSTLILALFACVVVLDSSVYFEAILFGSIAGASLLIIALPFIPVFRMTGFIKNNIVIKIANFINTLQKQLKLSRGVFLVYILSAVSTALDFLTAQYTVKAFGVDVDLFHISVAWAASALVSVIGFVIMGSSEISVIYLYEYFLKIEKAITASSIVISRIINLLVLAVLFLLMILFTKRRLLPGVSDDINMESEYATAGSSMSQEENIFSESKGKN